jgi:hypothetical protein
MVFQVIVSWLMVAVVVNGITSLLAYLYFPPLVFRLIHLLLVPDQLQFSEVRSLIRMPALATSWHDIIQEQSHIVCLVTVNTPDQSGNPIETVTPAECSRFAPPVGVQIVTLRADETEAK